jgi:hypothetical protein
MSKEVFIPYRLELNYAKEHGMAAERHLVLPN